MTTIQKLEELSKRQISRFIRFVAYDPALSVLAAMERFQRKEKIRISYKLACQFRDSHAEEITRIAEIRRGDLDSIKGVPLSTELEQLQHLSTILDKCLAPAVRHLKNGPGPDDWIAQKQEFAHPRLATVVITAAHKITEGIESRALEREKMALRAALSGHAPTQEQPSL